jgi:hypothetical protein
VLFTAFVAIQKLAVILPSVLGVVKKLAATGTDLFSKLFLIQVKDSEWLHI